VTAAAHVQVDLGLCASTGTCEMVAPDLFEITDDGDLVVLADPVPADQVDAARKAARACPTRALKVVDV
jgi:ferredoxin